MVEQFKKVFLLRHQVKSVYLVFMLHC